MTSCWIKYFNKEWPPTWLINILHAWCIDIRPLSEIEANPEICSANQNQSAITRNNTFYAYSWTDWIINALHWASKPRRLWGWPIFFLLISLTCYLISTRNSILSWTRGDRKCKRTFINRVLCESSEESETSPSCETSFTASLLVLSLILICNHPILYQSHPVFPYLRICQVGRECNLTVFTRVYWARSYQWTTPWGRLLILQYFIHVRHRDHTTVPAGIERSVCGVSRPQRLKGKGGGGLYSHILISHC